MPTLLNSTQSFRTKLFRKEKEEEKEEGERRGMNGDEEKEEKQKEGFVFKKYNFFLSNYLFAIATDTFYRCIKIYISETTHFLTSKNFLS